MKITFGANYITSTTIKTLDKNKNKIDKEVSIVELDKDSTQDKLALRDAASYWDVKGSQNFAWNIYSAMGHRPFPDVEDEKFIAITTQKRNFENLNPKQILGVAMISLLYRDENHIDWFQVKSKHNYTVSKNTRKYSHIGQAMLNYIKDTYGEKPLYVLPETKAIKFYKKNGFDLEEDFNYNYVYCK